MNTIIQLAPGNIGWYDEVTGIHLTIARNTAIVKPGMNTTNIRRAIKDRKVQVLVGNLEQETTEPVAFVSNNMVKEEVPVVKEAEAINYNKECLEETKEKVETKPKKTTRKNKK